MKTIIAPTDFSSAAKNAVFYAADLATATGAALLLLHVWKLPINYDGMVSPVLSNDLLKESRDNMHALEQEIAARKKNLSVSTKIVTGDFFAELKKLCDTKQPYAVVLGSQGTTAAERAVFGGHTVYTMKYLSWPVITVPPNVQFSSIKNIGIACDLKNVRQTVPVTEIMQLARLFNAHIHVLNTGKEGNFNPDIIAQSTALTHMFADITPAYHFITSNDTDEGIMHFAEENNIDLLIVIPRHHGLVDKLIHRSHTRQMVLHSAVPVLSLHAAAG